MGDRFAFQRERANLHGHRKGSVDLELSRAFRSVQCCTNGKILYMFEGKFWLL